MIYKTFLFFRGRKNYLKYEVFHRHLYHPYVSRLLTKWRVGSRVCSCGMCIHPTIDPHDQIQ